MNERIQELAKQADNYAYKMNPEQDSYGRSANPRKFQQDRDAKFAELMIKECAEQITLKGTDWMDWAPSQQAVRPEYVAMAEHIKQHFGVEQTASQKMAEAGYTLRPRGWTREGEE